MENKIEKENEVKSLKFDDMQTLEQAYIRGEIVFISVKEYNNANKRFLDLQQKLKDKDSRIEKLENYCHKYFVDCEKLSGQLTVCRDLNLIKDKLVKEKDEFITKLRQDSNVKLVCEEIKKHFDNNFYFDISGAMCVLLKDLDVFLEQVSKRSE